MSQRIKLIIMAMFMMGGGIAMVPIMAAFNVATDSKFDVPLYALGFLAGVVLFMGLVFRR
jgi:hypothetical protein